MRRARDVDARVQARPAPTSGRRPRSGGNSEAPTGRRDRTMPCPLPGTASSARTPGGHSAGRRPRRPLGIQLRPVPRAGPRRLRLRRAPPSARAHLRVAGRDGQGRDRGPQIQPGAAGHHGRSLPVRIGGDERPGETGVSAAEKPRSGIGEPDERVLDARGVSSSSGLVRQHREAPIDLHGIARDHPNARATGPARRPPRVLPTAVGPRRPMTTPGQRHDAPVPAPSRPPLTPRCRPRKLVEVALEQHTRTRSPGAASTGSSRFVSSRPPHHLAGRVATRPLDHALPPSCPTIAWLRSRPRRWTTSTRRAMRSSATAAGRPSGQCRGRGIAARRVDEGEGAVEIALLDEREGLPEVGLGLSREADDQVGGERQVGHRPAQPGRPDRDSPRGRSAGSSPPASGRCPTAPAGARARKPGCARR